MISIVVCSRNSKLLQKFQINVNDTIGVDFELIILDNSNNTYSIFSAYNEGAKRAKYPYICFAHEDILFHTQDWGIKIVNHFKCNNIGLIGMAGTHFFPKSPIYWTDSPLISENNLTNSNGKLIECVKLDFFNDGDIIDVVACDGFCMFIRKELFTNNEIRFDNVNYTGFHYYDMDICLQILKKQYRVCICNDILIEHFWTDNYSNKSLDSFYDNQKRFYEKWKSFFPITRGIDHIPPYVIERIDRLFIANEELRMVRKSKTYLIGKIIISPFKFLKSLILK